jgi:[ribosomal protein S5]-alanine N-acetyltransferase
MTQLITKRLLLRKPERTDAPDIQRLANHPVVGGNTLNIPYPYPAGAAGEFLTRVAESWANGDNYSFAVTRREDSTFIGMTGIHGTGHNRAELGYWIGEPFWGQGYATEAARRVIQFGFEAMALNRIQANYFTHNPASRRVMEKAGMTFEGVLRDYYLKNGAYVDVGVCSILRREYIISTP